MAQTEQQGAAESGGAQEKAKERAEQGKQVAQEKAREATAQARGRLREQVDQRSVQAADQVSSNVDDLRTVGEELRKQGKEKPAQLADQLAERGDRLGSYLRESDADRILGDVEDLGRQRPWAVALGGLALGFAASRVLKASSERRYAQRSGERGSGTREPEGGAVYDPSGRYVVS